MYSRTERANILVGCWTVWVAALVLADLFLGAVVLWRLAVGS